jgi:hypothetical protein
MAKWYDAELSRRLQQQQAALPMSEAQDLIDEFKERYPRASVEQIQDAVIVRLDESL